MKLLEGLATTDEVYQAVYETTKKLNKTPVEVHDFPGFVSNRILMPMINEAVFTLYEGVANEEDIDQVMKLGMNHPMGPLTLATSSASIHVCLLWKRFIKGLVMTNIVLVHAVGNM